jgi:hypothetical protein
MKTNNYALKKIESEIRDGENNLALYDIAYSVNRDHFQRCLNEIESAHGTDILFLPLSGTSSGGDVFQAKPEHVKLVVGLQFSPTTQPRIECRDSIDLEKISLDEIIIDRERREISAGASITLDQLNGALKEKLGYEFRVLGADLTSYTYAQVGATFMTGGMGPQRRYFSDSVLEIALYNGKEIINVHGSDLLGYAGTYGWSGMVTAVKCRFHRLPRNEIAFALPVDNSPAGLASLLEHFAPYCFLKNSDETLSTTSDSTSLILGLEHITISSMQPFLESTADQHTLNRAQKLIENCKNSNADGLIFVNGYSNLDADEFIMDMIDNTDEDRLTICGMDLEYTEVFKDAEEMRHLREAVPYAARIQEPSGRFIYKNHSDANIRLNPDMVAQDMEKLWSINMSYVNEVNQHLNSTENLLGSILIYGHMNPYGVDPHNRVTFATDNQDIFEAAKQKVGRLRDDYYRKLNLFCQASGSEFIGGEKGADSEHKMYTAFNGAENAPRLMREKFEAQVQEIKNASIKFSWRAFSPYSQS